jgi:ankyrin repeat protein
VHILQRNGRLMYGAPPGGEQMQAILTALAGLLLAVGGSASAGPGQTPRHTNSAAEIDRVRLEVQARIARGADPVRDAAEAARRGDFRLITLGHLAARPAGVTCFTPYWQAPEILTYLRHGDVIDEQISAWYRYASSYNQTSIDMPGHPQADLCRAEAESDHAESRGYFPVATAARTISTPPITLHEAARRGNARDVRRLLASSDVDAMDGLDMTPLAWAVARDNIKAVDLLLKAGANPWISGPRKQDALFWAAQLGRRSYFERMEQLPGRPFREWPAMHLSAAASGGDSAIIARMLEQPHAAFRLDLLLSPLPSAAALEPIVKREPALANTLLWTTTDYPADRPDLVELALRLGADPNVTGSGGRYGTILGAFATGISPASVEIVDMLLKSGADPNLMSHRERPIWIAVRTLRLGSRHTEVEARATAVFQKLLKAGADLNLADDQGVPPARLLLFPYRGRHDLMDASFVTPSMLEMLVSNGLDLNSQWQGKRILPLVDAQAGASSELALTLRRLGARP